VKILLLACCYQEESDNVLVLPVKLITRMSLDSTRSAEPPPPVLSLKTLIAPLGRSGAVRPFFA